MSEGKKESAAEVSDRKKITGSTKIGQEKHKRTVPSIEHVGDQVKICEAFGFEIPDECAPEYVVRKTNKGKRGRPRKNKLVVKEEN